VKYRTLNIKINKEKRQICTIKKEKENQKREKTNST